MAYKYGSCKECVKASVCKFRETREYILKDITSLYADKYHDSCFMISEECKEFLSNNSVWTSRNSNEKRDSKDNVQTCFCNVAQKTSSIIET